LPDTKAAPEETLEKELAAEIRAAIAEAAAPSGRAAEGGDAPRDSVRIAENYLTPTIPEGAPLASAKKTVLRGLRFLWRDQSTFNALALESFHRLRHELATLQQQFGTFRAAAEREIGHLRRLAAAQDARLASLASRAAPEPARAAPPGPSEAVPAGVYSLFQERFRGSTEAIAQSQRFYVDFLRGVPGPVLDVGCGRGEFLRLLREEKIPALGVDSSPVSVAFCRADGFDVEEGDALATLGRRPAASLGGVVAFQVVEHWPPDRIFAFLTEARRVLAPDGVLIVETVNTDSVSSLRSFFLDPTHVRPVPSEALAFFAEAAGFPETRVEFRSPQLPEARLSETTENDVKLNRLLFGPQDYALIARVPLAGREA